jgi:hypothetical protein
MARLVVTQSNEYGAALSTVGLDGETGGGLYEITGRDPEAERNPEYLRTFVSEIARHDARKAVARMTTGVEWPELDLADVYAEGVELPNPEVMPRIDGQCLLYAGLPNCIFGDAGSGKTALAQSAAEVEIRAQRHVYLVDYETHVKVWLARFRALGLTDAEVVEYFHYFDVAQGERPPTPAPESRLVIIDSLTAAIDAGGYDPNDAQGIEAVYRQAVTPFTRAGLAALVIDHVGHADKTRPMNSVRKTGIVQGAMYRMEVIKGMQFGRDRLGEALLYLHKDNMGGVDAAKGDIVAKFVMGSTHGGTKVTCKLVAGNDLATLSNIARGVENTNDQRKSKILDALADGRELTRSAIKSTIGGKTEAVNIAIDELVADGILVHERRGNGDHFWLRL